MSTIRCGVTMFYDVFYLFFKDTMMNNSVCPSFEKEWFVPIKISYITKEFLLLFVVKVGGMISTAR